MTKQISINEAELPLLIDFYRSRIATKEVELSALKRTLMSLEGGNSIMPINSNTNDSVSEDGYNSVWTWVRKIDFIIGSNKLTTAEIVSKVLYYEPSLKDSRSKIVGSISAVLSVKSKDNKYYTKEVNDRGEFIYGLSSEHKLDVTKEHEGSLFTLK